MKLKGDYSGETSYSVGDVVRFTDGNVYHLQKPCTAGVPPVNTRYWGRANQALEDAVIMVLDMEEGDVTLEDDLNQSTGGKKALDAHQGKVLDENKLDKSKVYNDLDKTAEGFALDARQGKALKDLIPNNISAEAITLKDQSDNEYLITVDASGESPELVVTLIEPVTPAEESQGEGGE